MLLAMSVGNSHITFGVHQGHEWVRRWRIQTVAARTSDEYLVVLRTLLDAAQVPGRKVSSAILASVVPPLTATMGDAIRELTGRVPLLLSPALDLGLRITTENPSEVGSDLVANAVAAFDRFRGNCVVVDFGTALSFTAVAAPGELRGVAIAPGLTAAMQALAQTTAQLFTVPLEAPAVTVGRNSTQSIQAGIVYGYVGLIREIVRRMRAELGGDADLAVTGGQSPIIAPLLGEKLLHEPWLTLEGLRIVAERGR